MRIVAMADTHGYHQGLTVPEGDLLVHAGDLNQRGTLPQLEEAGAWLRSLPHRHQVVIAGDHDFALQQRQVTGDEAIRRRGRAARLAAPDGLLGAARPGRRYLRGSAPHSWLAPGFCTEPSSTESW